jgi:hypothetical protein
VRHLTTVTEDRIVVLPRLGDRSIVAKPSVLLRVLPGGEGQIYVSTPIWFSVQTKSGLSLIDVPWQRPSDSWFGPSTRTGELCYAKYTDARLIYDNIEHHAHRAVTPIKIINRHEQAFTIESINVPIPLLNLYQSQLNYLWTQPLTIVRESDDSNIETEIKEALANESIGATLLTEARDISEKKPWLEA